MTGALHDVADFVERFNALPASIEYERTHARKRWNRWNIRRVLESGGVRFVQKSKRGKLVVAESEIRRVFPEFLDSLLDAEAIERARLRGDREPY